MKVSINSDKSVDINLTSNEARMLLKVSKGISIDKLQELGASKKIDAFKEQLNKELASAVSLKA